MSDPSDATALLRRFLGTWEGTGHGRFPTIEPFRYSETLRFTAREGLPDLFYEQSTWLIQDEGEPSHWEAGFLLPKEDGSIHLLNAQQSGRTEVLIGRLREDESGLELVLESASHTHDPRMVATTRTYQLRGDELRYEACMATDQVAELQRHLECELVRVNAAVR